MSPTSQRRKTQSAPASQEESGLAEEIASLREMLRQASQLSESDLPPAARLRLLDIYSRATGRLASLLKMQQNLAGEQGAGDALSSILREANAEIAKNKLRFPEP